LIFQPEPFNFRLLLPQLADFVAQLRQFQIGSAKRINRLASGAKVRNLFILVGESQSFLLLGAQVPVFLAKSGDGALLNHDNGNRSQQHASRDDP